jgi:hypothetical protein
MRCRSSQADKPCTPLSRFVLSAINDIIIQVNLRDCGLL